MKNNNILDLTGFSSCIGTVDIGTVFISNGVDVGSFKYAANALSNPTTDTFNAETDK